MINYSRICAVILILCPTAAAQAPHRERFKLFNASDAAYWTGGLLDVGSSIGQRELNPLFRDRNGTFSPAKNVTFKLGLWGAFKLLESHYAQPKERRLIGWFKIGAGAVFAAVAVHNFQQPRRPHVP